MQRKRIGVLETLASALIGTWRLVSREDRTPVGERRVDPGLGADPLAILVYDSAGNFSAQFMKRDRADGATAPPAAPGSNNSVAVSGYDAYFGTYTVDEEAGTVTQHLVGALSPGDVGKVVTRELRIEDDRLTIELVTSSADGEALARTLIWARAT